MHFTWLAGLSAFAAAVMATNRSSVCPWGHCDDEDFSYMNLLQVRADSRHAAMPGADDTFKYDGSMHIKKTRPFYHTSDEIQQEVELLSKGCGGALSISKHSDSGVDIDVVRVRAPNSNPVNRVFILFGEHSRELIGPESGLRLLQVICGKFASTVKVPSILLESEFQLVLNGNPNSRTKVEAGNYCLRTNPNGVDLNRNWDEMWSNHDTGGSNTNPGPAPFSEPETRIFKKLAEDFLPTTFLTVHSGTRGLYMPFAYDMEHSANFNQNRMLNVLKNLDENHCQCPYGAAGKEVGYPCPGTCLDWVYSKLRTPYVFAFEIYTSEDRDDDLKRRWQEKVQSGGAMLLQSGNHLGHGHFAELFDSHTSDFVSRRAGDAAEAETLNSNDSDECFSMFNPSTEMSYNTTVQNWADAYLEMADIIAGDIKKYKHLLKGMPTNTSKVDA